jgi:hypothetical protein
MDKETLGSIFNKHKTDKGPWRHGYHQCYYDLFKEFTPTKMLEIGVLEGRSLAAWKEIFPQATIHGLDKFPTELVEGARDMTIFKGDSRDKAFIEATTLKDYDVIIDDGDHRVDSQWATFLNLKDSWSKYYIFEDVVNEDNEQILRRRLKSAGIKNITTYRSGFRGNVQIWGKQVNSSFFAVVARKE